MFFTIRLLGTKLVSSRLFLPGIIQVIKNSVLKNIAPSVSSGQKVHRSLWFVL